MRLRFLLDEHIDRAAQRQLRRREPRLEVLAIGDRGVPPAGSPDPEILIWLETHRYVLVTENRSTIPTHLAAHLAAGRHVPGVLLIRPDTGVGRLIEELYLIWIASTADEFQDRAVFIPL